MQKRDFLCKVILIYSNEMRGVEVKLQESLAPLESSRLQCNRLDGRGSAQFCNKILKTFSTGCPSRRTLPERTYIGLLLLFAFGEI